MITAKVKSLPALASNLTMKEALAHMRHHLPGGELLQQFYNFVEQDREQVDYAAQIEFEGLRKQWDKVDVICPNCRSELTLNAEDL